MVINSLKLFLFIWSSFVFILNRFENILFFWEYFFAELQKKNLISEKDSKVYILFSDYPNARMLNKRRQTLLDRNRILISCLSPYSIQLCSNIDRPLPFFLLTFIHTYQKWSNTCTLPQALRNHINRVRIKKNLVISILQLLFFHPCILCC